MMGRLGELHLNMHLIGRTAHVARNFGGSLGLFHEKVRYNTGGGVSKTTGWGRERMGRGKRKKIVRQGNGGALTAFPMIDRSCDRSQVP